MTRAHDCGFYLPTVSDFLDISDEFTGSQKEFWLVTPHKTTTNDHTVIWLLAIALYLTHKLESGVDLLI